MPTAPERLVVSSLSTPGPRRARHVLWRWARVLAVVLVLVVGGVFGGLGVARLFTDETADEPVVALSTSTTSTTPSPAPPAVDPLVDLQIGECVQMDSTVRPGSKTRTYGDPVRMPCEDLRSNFRLVQYGPCNLPQVVMSKVVTSSPGGGVLAHHCFAVDWRADTCYDITDWNAPTKQECLPPGNGVVQVTQVFEGVMDVHDCPLGIGGATSVTWDDKQLTLCMRGKDRTR